jgi:general secretion pathway protein D
MVIRMGKDWSAIALIFAVLLMSGLSSAAQGPGRSPISEEERRRMLENLTRQMQESQTGAKQPPGFVQPQPANMPAAQFPASSPAPGPSPARTQKTNAARSFGSNPVTLSYDNTNLIDVINQVTTTLGLTPLIIDPEVKGSVTINTLESSPLNQEDLRPLFDLILKNNHAALIFQNGVYKIIPTISGIKEGLDIIMHSPSDSETTPKGEETAKPEGTSSKTNKESSASATSSTQAQTNAKAALSSSRSSTSGADSKGPHLSTHVIPVEFIAVKDLIEPIKAMTDGAVIMPWEQYNMLIITDYSDNIDRVVKIIRMLDNRFLDPELFEWVEVKNNSAADVVDDLKKFFGSGSKDAATGVQFIPLDHKNLIFVLANSKRSLSTAKAWIEKLDSTTGRNIQTFVYYVKKSTASNIAMMLSALYGEDGSSDSTTGTGVAGGNAGVGTTGFGGNANRNNMQGGGGFGGNSGFGGRSNQSGAMNSSFQGGLSQNSSFGGGYGGGGSFGNSQSNQRLGPRLNTNPTISSQVLRGGAFAGLQDVIHMVVDDINNTLYFQATPADYSYISEAIEKMDVLPRQVLIDARIFEVDLTDDLSFGVTGLLQKRTDGQHLTSTGVGTFSSAGALTSSSLTASTFAFIGSSREILLNLEALRTKTKVKILEAPSILALDGTQAKFMVGAEVPYSAGFYTQATGGETTNVQYRETGVSLLVLPKISASGSITLNLAQEVSSPNSTSSLNPTFGKTLVETTLAVQDGQTVAIAGLIRDNKTVGRAGVPLLSEIPIIGHLFGSTTRNSNRTELIILITPHVIQTVDKLQEATQELKDTLRNVHKLVKEKDEERTKDIQESREERYKQDQKRLNSTAPSTAPERKPGQ